MGKQNITLANIELIDDGVISREWSHKLNQLRADMADRPMVMKPRTITLEMELVPSRSSTMAADIKFKIKTKVPPAGSRVYEVGVGQTGLSFNPASPHNVNQRTLDEIDRVDKETGEVLGE